jgi:hypothetical protein
MSAIGPNYSAAAARDGAMNQATTRTAKLMNATAIISWLLRLNQWDLHPGFDARTLIRGSVRISSSAVISGSALVARWLRFGTTTLPTTQMNPSSRRSVAQRYKCATRAAASEPGLRSVASLVLRA